MTKGTREKEYKMGFQQQVNLGLAAGIAGQPASLNPAVYDTNNFPAGENGVTAGLAVWADYSEGNVNNKGTGAPLGIALAVMNYGNMNLDLDASMLIPEGQTVTVLKKGDVYVNCTTAAAPGQKIYANTANGTFSANDTGQSVDSSVETDWYVAEGAEETNSLILISNWS